MDKKVVYFGAAVGGFVGGWLPTLFGAGAFSLWTILTSTIGGLLGIWAVYKWSQ